MVLVRRVDQPGDLGLVHGCWKALSDADWCLVVLGLVWMLTRRLECDALGIFYYVQGCGHFESLQNIYGVG